MCRIIADKLSVRLGQPVVVDNKPGAATVLGTAEAAKAPPDGYTFLITIMSSMVGNRVLRANHPDRPAADRPPELLRPFDEAFQVPVGGARPPDEEGAAGAGLGPRLPVLPRTAG